MTESILASITAYAKLLRLPEFANVKSEIKRMGPEDDAATFLLRMMQKEYKSRQDKQRERRLKSAGFPIRKTMDTFELEKLEHVKPEFIKQLAGCDFIKESSNIIMVGNPGTGKTHLMTAIGINACELGYKVIFRTARALVTELREARDDFRLQKLRRSLSKADLLLLDELSYAKWRQDEAELLFGIIAERAELKSTIITTNMEFAAWTEMFENEALVAAMVDRLTYHSYVLNMNGESYRLGETIRNIKGS